MSKNKICSENPTIAMASFGLYVVQIKHIEYGINDYVYCTTPGKNETVECHKCMVFYGNRPYFKIHRQRVYLDECLRTI